MRSHLRAIRFFCVLFLTVVLGIPVLAAGSHRTVSGTIRDAESREVLIGATVYIAELKAGGTANTYGFYSLTVPAGSYQLRFSMVGYTEQLIPVTLDSNIRLDILLTPRQTTVDSVVVSARSDIENVTKAEMGATTLSPAQVADVPILFGEQDILKTIQMLPGVQEAGEGNIGFYVRGGGVDQNLVLLDEANVYNASHLLGFFSVFNSDAIRDVKLYKGIGSAEYGGRLSSVLDVKMKEGNGRKLRGSAGIGIISSRGLIEGPIVPDKSSFIVTGRRTYVDLFLKAAKDSAVRKTTLYFYDLNAKANYQLGRNDRLYLSGYFGRDVLGYRGEFGVDWGNGTGTMRWNHLFSDRLFLNSSFIYTHYGYNVGVQNGDELVTIKSAIEDVTLKEDAQYFLNAGNNFRFGGQLTYHTFLPGKIDATQSSVNRLVLKNKYAVEYAAYLNHELTLSPSFSLDYGLRLSGFSQYGPGDVFTFDASRTPYDTVHYGPGKLIAAFGGIEPRGMFRFSLSDADAIKGGYARQRQYLHLLSNSTTASPFDLWYPSTKYVQPGTADQFSVGYFRNFRGNSIETSLELYYKDLQHEVDYRNGADVFFNENVEAELIYGKGRAYGAELFLKKRTGRLSGWIGYTLSRTERQFDQVNNGRWYPARQDRRHDIEIVSVWQLSRKWTMGINWVYYTGNAVTFPSGKYIIDGYVVNLFTERNGYRMPAYHRLDLGFTLKNSHSSWNFSLYNAYGRRNAYAIDFRKSKDDPSVTQAVRISLLTFFPAVTYNLEF